MHVAIPIFYSEYGRYITRFRSIPLYIDALIVVYRRVLVSAYNITKNGRFVKSARIVGDTIGKYHPHGDQSCYQSLVKMVRRGFLDPDSNFGKIGAVTDAPAAAMRYTECRISKWVIDFAFKYIDYVPWDVLEQGMEKEPLYLPAPVPIGVIGDNGVYSGMAFHKTTIPYYTIKDLAVRLKALLNNEKDKYIIKPYIRYCHIQNAINDSCKNILENGSGKITVIPTVQMTNEGLLIIGKSRSYKALFENDYSRNKKFEGYCLDESEGEDCKVLVEPINKKVDLNKLLNDIFPYIKSNISIDCIFCDFEGKIIKMGIDQLLLNNYNAYIYAVKNKRRSDVEKNIERLRKNSIIAIIKQIYNNKNINRVSDLITEFQKLPQESKCIQIQKYDDKIDNWRSTLIQISENDIQKVVESSPIKKLIEVEVDLPKIQADIQMYQQKYFETENDCYKIIDELSKI